MPAKPSTKPAGDTTVAELDRYIAYEHEVQRMALELMEELDRVWSVEPDDVLPADHEGYHAHQLAVVLALMLSPDNLPDREAVA